MVLLFLGLVIFLGTHSLRAYAPDFRGQMVRALGDGPFRALYSLVALVGLVLIVIGYDAARPGVWVLYYSPMWLKGIAGFLMIFAFASLAVSLLPAGRLKPMLRHPMLLAVKIWAFAHILANGDLASLLLFLAFLGWAVADRISFRRREAAGKVKPVAPGPMSNDVIAIAISLVVYVLFVWKLHYWLIGVQPMT